MYSKCDQKNNYDNLKCSEMNKSPCIRYGKMLLNKNIKIKPVK